MKSKTHFDKQYEESKTQSEDTSVTLPIVEEEIQVSKEITKTGKISLSKKVHKEEVTVNVPIIHEEVDVQKIEINTYVETPPSIRHEGETMIIPILKEVLVVEKRLMLVEEIHITKRKIQTDFSKKETIQKEEIVVNRTSNEPSQ